MSIVYQIINIVSDLNMKINWGMGWKSGGLQMVSDVISDTTVVINQGKVFSLLDEIFSSRGTE